MNREYNGGQIQASRCFETDSCRIKCCKAVSWTEASEGVTSKTLAKH